MSYKLAESSSDDGVRNSNEHSPSATQAVESTQMYSIICERSSSVTL
jgi:hypothetical protein